MHFFQVYDEYDVKIFLADFLDWVNLFPGLAYAGRAEPLATSSNYPYSRSLDLMDEEKCYLGIAKTSRSRSEIKTSMILDVFAALDHQMTKFNL